MPGFPTLEKKNKMILANRIGETVESTRPIGWHHIDTHSNPTVQGTRRMHTKKSYSVWIRGSEILMRKEEHWTQIGDKTCSLIQSCNQSQEDFTKLDPRLNDINRFSLLATATVFTLQNVEATIIKNKYTESIVDELSGNFLVQTITGTRFQPGFVQYP